jgi:protein-tyrosine-phosphatase
MIRVLFVCSRNELRSPAAEPVFSSIAGFEVDIPDGCDYMDPGSAVR